MRLSRSPGTMKPGETGFTSAASVSFHLCELRHITLPRIDLHCRRFLPDWDPSPMAGSFLRSALRGPRRRVPAAPRFILTDRPVLPSQPAEPSPATLSGPWWAAGYRAVARFCLGALLAELQEPAERLRKIVAGLQVYRLAP